MMKYLQLKNGQYIAEHVICFIGIEDGVICVEYLDAGRIAKATVEITEPRSLESVVAALLRKLAEEE